MYTKCIVKFILRLLNINQNAKYQSCKYLNIILDMWIISTQYELFMEVNLCIK